MKRLEVVPLSKPQARLLRKAYSDGDIKSEMLTNLLYGTPGDTLEDLRLHVLPITIPAPHFHFEGNRRYGMALVTDGDTYGVLSWQSTPRSRVGTVRMEIVEHADLPFMKVNTPPDSPALFALAARFIRFCVEGWKVLPEGEDKSFGYDLAVMVPGRSTKTDGFRKAILDGQDPEKVLDSILSLPPQPLRKDRPSRRP